MWFFKKKEVNQAQNVKSYMFGTSGGLANSFSLQYNNFAFEGYVINPIVRGCINKIATAITSVDIKAYKKDADGSLVEVPNHPALLLLNNPNKMQSVADFIQQFVSHYLIGGNVYVYASGISGTKAKPPLELYIYDPEKVKVIAGDTIMPVAYEYRTKDKTITYPVDLLTGYSAIMHKKTFNPVDDFYGLSPMTAAAFGIDILNHGQRWNLGLLKNEARPSGALIFEGSGKDAVNLTSEQISKLREELTQVFAGSSNSGRPLILDGGMKWQELSMSAVDMSHESNMNKAARDTALVFGVPPMLLGIQGDATYANMAEARLAFWTDTVLPLLQSILDSLNNWFNLMYKDEVILWYDEDMIPALEPLRKMKADRIEASNSMTINEKRLAMGIEAIEGGDTLFVEASKVPLALAGQVDFNANVGG